MSVLKFGDNKFKIKAFARRHGRSFKKEETFTGTEKQAREREFEITLELRKRAKEAQSQAVKKIATFGELIDICYASGIVSKSMSYCWKRLKKECNNYPIAQLREKLAAYFRLLDTERSYKGTLLSNNTKNLLLRTTKRICNFCHEIDKIPQISFKHIKGWRTTPRKRELSLEEESRLLRVLEREYPHLLPAVQFALKNPIAKSDLFSLKKGNLDPGREFIVYTRLKTNVTAQCIIFPEFEKYLRSLPDECDYLFYRYEGGKYIQVGDFKKSWQRALRIAGVSGFRFHDLRHHATGWLLKRGVQSWAVQRIGGWKSRAMVEQYHSGDPLEAAQLAKNILFNGTPQQNAPLIQSMVG